MSTLLTLVDTWVVGLSPLATDAQRATAIDAMDGLLPLLAANGVQGLDDLAAHVAVLMQPHDGSTGLVGPSHHDYCGLVYPKLDVLPP